MICFFSLSDILYHWNNATNLGNIYLLITPHQKQKGSKVKSESFIKEMHSVFGNKVYEQAVTKQCSTCCHRNTHNIKGHERAEMTDRWETWQGVVEHFVQWWCMEWVLRCAWNCVGRQKGGHFSDREQYVQRQVGLFVCIGWKALFVNQRVNFYWGLEPEEWYTWSDLRYW